MRIIFGTNSFKIKSYKAEDLNIANDKMENVTFEVRQKYFHLFWIPFFGYEKIYALRKGGQLYNLPENIELLIKNKEKLKTPWYSFSLPLLILLGITIYLLYIKHERHLSHQYEKNKYEYSLKQTNKELSNLTINHFIKIRSLNNWGNTEGLFLKVEKIQDTVIKVFILNTGLNEYNIDPYAIKDFYIKHRTKFDTLTLSLGELQKSICNDFEIYDSKGEFGRKLLGDNIKYIIESIDYNEGPMIRNKGVSGSATDLELHNFGSHVKLIEIRNIENNITWTNNLPMEIKSNDYFILHGDNYKDDTKFKFLLVFKDSLQKEYKYIMEGKNFNQRLERVIE